MLQPALAEIAKKGIARAQGKKAESWPLAAFRLGEESIDDLVGGAVAADRQEIALAAGVGLAGDGTGVPGAAGFRQFQFDAAGAQPAQGFVYQFAAAPPTRGPVYHCQKAPAHKGTTAESRSGRSRPISSASAVRLIFSDAVRGKSRSHSTYPPTRLKSGRRRLRLT